MNHPRRDPRGLLTNDATLGTEEPLTEYNALEVLKCVEILRGSQASPTFAIEDITARNATETNYAFESCKPAYEAHIEATNLASNPGHSASVKRGKLPEFQLDLPRDGKIAGSRSSLGIPEASLLALHQSSMETLATVTESTAAGSFHQAQQAHNENSEGELGGDSAASAPLFLNDNQASPSNTNTFLRPTSQSEQNSASLHLSPSSAEGGPTLGHEASNDTLDYVSSVRVLFEDHTRHERSNSRTMLNLSGPCPLPQDADENLPHAEKPATRSQAIECSQLEVILSRPDFALGRAQGTAWSPSMPASTSDKAALHTTGEVAHPEQTAPKLSVLELWHYPMEVPSDAVSIYSGMNGRDMALQAASSLVHNPSGILRDLRPSNRGADSTSNFEGSSLVRKYRSDLEESVDTGRLAQLNFSQLVPEAIPFGYTNITYLSTRAAKRSSQMYHLGRRLAPIFTVADVAHLAQDRLLPSILRTVADGWPMFPRVFKPRPFSVTLNAPPLCSPSSEADTWRYDTPVEVLVQTATQHLSHEDVRNLRLVNKEFCALFSPTYFRNLVTRFGPSMFTPTQRFGDSINKFGISFEVDLPSLGRVQKKVAEEVREAFWGSYEWPKPAYQRFPELKALEDLVDENAPLLKKTLQNLPIASELALSIDSGHGWLNGPDLSDMQLWRIRYEGAKVFGKTFKTADKWQEHLRDELFLWAQQNTINQTTKFLVERASTEEGEAAFKRTRAKLRWLRNIQCRNYESFELVSNQAAELPTHHTGGTPPPPPAANNNLFPGQPPAPPPGLFPGTPNAQLQIQPLLPVAMGAGTGGIAAPQPAQPTQAGNRSRKQRARGPHVVQWPLIFNGYSLDAEVGGENKYIQDKVAKPITASLKPGCLTETQSQYLMETVWAQRAFLSAYTTSIILNKAKLQKIHTLTIAKLSSGLLPSLEQDEFWRALPGLKNLTIMISPDWRQEHTPGDKSFQSNMLISPVKASAQFTGFLKRYICKLEYLSKLKIGFVGGGEHAPGLMARNQHVLPAPITQEPRAWLSDHITTPSPDTMISFDHIEELRFVNCWFSPCMLLAFMEKARDTSLRHLILDSVSLTAHGASSASITGPATPIPAIYGTGAWLNETLPNEGCWPAILDDITPGLTFLEQKEAVGLHLSEKNKQRIRDKSFRGNVQEITLNSCGYVHISGVKVTKLNQVSILTAQHNALDRGLRERKCNLEIGQTSPRPMTNTGPVGIVYHPGSCSPEDVSNRLMMGTNDAYGREYFGLGTLTQAVHPVEKRILEQCWNMRFGWGDDMKRWSAVDDGCHMGGTGRFSGKVLR